MRRVVMCGIPRSGSTLVWQVLSEILDVEIPKTHPAAWVPDGSSLAVVTIRHPMDVAASRWRVRLSRGGDGVDNREGMEAELSQLSLHFAALSITMEEPHVLLRYEDFVQDMAVIWNEIRQTFGLLVFSQERRRVEEKFSLQSNRDRAAKLANFNEWDEHHIHGDHIGPVLPGTWRQILPEWSLAMVHEVCDPIAAEWGYDKH